MAWYDASEWYAPDLDWLSAGAAHRRMLVDVALEAAFDRDETEAVHLLDEGPPGLKALQAPERVEVVHAVEDLLVGLLRQYGPSFVADVRLRGRTAGPLRLHVATSAPGRLTVGNLAAGAWAELPCDLLEEIRVVRGRGDAAGVREPRRPAPSLLSGWAR